MVHSGVFDNGRVSGLNPKNVECSNIGPEIEQNHFLISLLQVHVMELSAFSFHL